jgi:hypothetical protein
MAPWFPFVQLLKILVGQYRKPANASLHGQKIAHIFFDLKMTLLQLLNHRNL